MPKLTVEGYGTFEVAENKRLVLAIEQDAKVDILHACGGNARCTTCRIEFIDGEPSRMTVAEKERLAQRELTGVRLSCQILCDHDMNVRAISRLEGSGRPDPGERRRQASSHRRMGASGCTDVTAGHVASKNTRESTRRPPAFWSSRSSSNLAGCVFVRERRWSA